MGEFGQGLTLSGIGVLITFMALGLLILLILALKVLFPAKDPIADLDQPAGDRDRLRKQAAAAGVAVLLKRKGTPREGNLGKLLETPPGPWWRKGLDRAQGRKE